MSTHNIPFLDEIITFPTYPSIYVCLRKRENFLGVRKGVRIINGKRANVRITEVYCNYATEYS